MPVILFHGMEAAGSGGGFVWLFLGGCFVCWRGLLCWWQLCWGGGGAGRAGGVSGWHFPVRADERSDYQGHKPQADYCGCYNQHRQGNLTDN